MLVHLRANAAVAMNVAVIVVTVTSVAEGCFWSLFRSFGFVVTLLHTMATQATQSNEKEYEEKSHGNVLQSIDKYIHIIISDYVGLGTTKIRIGKRGFHPNLVTRKE